MLFSESIRARTIYSNYLMIKFKQQPQLLNAKLTALWAVNESGLGGLLHALKIPFSGLLLGSFAVIIVTYIAYSNTNKFKAILKATVFVVLIKAMASPHSPPMAYVAVVFQGVLGAVLFGTFGINKITTISFGAIALLESAFQKILKLMLLFGMNLWDSILQFFDNMKLQLQLEWIDKLPWLFLITYGCLYLIIGVIAGNLAFKLPKKVFDNAKRLQNETLNFSAEKIKVKGVKRKQYWLVLCLLIFACLVFLMTGTPNKVFYIILRTLGAVIFFLFVFNPLFKYFLLKWVNKKKLQKQKSLNVILELMPAIKNNISLAQKLSAVTYKKRKNLALFIINWLSLSLYFVEDET